MRGRLFLILLCLYSSLPAQRTKQAAYSISGLVLNARDETPVRQGQVTASLVAAGRGGPREPVRTETDEAGRFLLELPSGGDWQINVSAYNVRPQNFDEHEGYFSGVILTPAAPTYDLVFHAIPDAVLTGTVTDEAGEPVRNAQILLFEASEGVRQTEGQPMRQKQGAQTDDRGHYEFASLEAGSYTVQVQARPWYAGNPGPPRSVAPAAPSLDPSLDLVYPVMWYPGVTELTSAGVILAHPGDQLQADMRLLPEPSAHLVLPAGEPSSAIRLRPGQDGEGSPPPQPFRGTPNISLILPNGTVQPVFGQISRDPRGNLDIGGLAPGTYQVSTPSGSDAPARISIVHLRAGNTLSDSGDPQQTTQVTISVDGDSGIRASQVVLRSMLTGQAFPEFNQQEMRDRPRSPALMAGDTSRPRSAQPQRSSQPYPPGRQGGQPSGQGSRSRGRSTGEGDDATLQVPPGQYEVSLASGASAFITGTSAKGATVLGKMVTVFEAPAHLTIHAGAGFAAVQGVASIAGKPDVGALVLLVPAALGDPRSLTNVHRDQTNTDGSFRVENVVPGAYILVAIDHGWSVRWTDPDTLRPYLMQGTPLDLHSGAAVNQKLIAVSR